MRSSPIAVLLGVALSTYASATFGNSCANVVVHGSFDASGLRESSSGLNTAEHSELRARIMKASSLCSISL